MKIKQKKQLNLPQLIEWGFNNPELVKGELYLTKEHDEYSPYVRFSADGYGVRIGQFISNNDTFTVEVEEEMTEDTHLDYLYALTNDEEKEIHRCMNFTIRNASMVIRSNYLTFFTLIDNDLVKIYENGKLVEQ